MSEAEGDAAEDPGFFDGRYVIEIRSWDWSLHVGMSREVVPPEYRFQGGLEYVRSFVIEGRLMAPAAVRDRRVQVWLSPFGSEMRSESDDLGGVGRLWRHDPARYGFDHSATLLIPESSISPTATCLASVWRYIHIWVRDDDGDELTVDRFTFGREIPANIAAWASVA